MSINADGFGGIYDLICVSTCMLNSIKIYVHVVLEYMSMSNNPANHDFL